MSNATEMARLTVASDKRMWLGLLVNECVEACWFAWVRYFHLVRVAQIRLLGTILEQPKGSGLACSTLAVEASVMLELFAGRLSAAAVAHLFRHLNDVDALQRNPLVRPWFEDRETRCIDQARARSAVRELRRLVLEGLEVAVSADLARNSDRRALRQQAIVKKLYFEGLARKRVARELGISMRQLHRERSHICERIAAYVCSHRPSSTSQSNGINFNVREYELERAQTAAEADLTDAALAILMGMLAPSSSWSDEPDVAITLADVAVSCGDFQLARHGLDLAKARLDRLRSNDARDALLSGRALLVTAKLLRAQGELDNARQALNQAFDIANRPADVPARVGASLD